MKKLPKLKKKVNAFLTREEGRISKEKLVKVGMVAGIAAAAIGSVDQVEAQTHTSSNIPSPGHTNDMKIDDSTLKYYGQHSHSAYTYTHSSHTSHSNHSEGGWC